MQWRKNLENDGKVSASMDDDFSFDDKISFGKWRDYSKQFESASQSFGSVAQKFDSAAQNYEQANQKIDRLTLSHYR